jgi:hypothetical protein
LRILRQTNFDKIIKTPDSSLLRLILLFLLLTGCAHLPEYAKPRMVEFENRPASHNHGFTYRALSVDDFQAQSLPDNLVSHTQNIAAHACCRIRTTEDASYKITRGYLNQQIQYFGTITHIAFEAVMVPACSWLNPKVTEEKLDYVLQHEQIHFALMEIAARDLTREAKGEAKDFLAIQSTYKATQGEVAARIKDLVRSTSEAVLMDHTAFDEETSLYFDPGIQQRWMERVEEQLLETTRENIND